MDQDLLDAFAHTINFFREFNLLPPTAILLGSHEEGMKLLSLMRQQNHWVAIVGSPDLGNVVEMADGSMWMEVQIMGVAVRWPANRVAMPDGSWSFA